MPYVITCPGEDVILLIPLLWGINVIRQYVKQNETVQAQQSDQKNAENLFSIPNDLKK